MGIILMPVLIIIFLVFLGILFKIKKSFEKDGQEISAKRLLGYNDSSSATLFTFLILLIFCVMLYADNVYDIDQSQSRFNGCGSYGPTCDINLVGPLLVTLLAVSGWFFLSALEDLLSTRFQKIVSFKAFRDLLLLIPVFYIALGVISILIWNPIFHFAI